MKTYKEAVLYDYKNVMEYCVQCIFNSGILLNEHNELLNEFWRSPNLIKAKHFKIYLTSATFLSGLITSIYKRSILFGTLSTIPLGIELGKKLFTQYKCRCYRKQFSLFLDISQKIYTLNKKIMEHYQMQKVTVSNLGENTKKLIEDIISKRILELLSDVSRNMLELTLFLKDALKQIGTIINIGELNFVFNINLSKEAFKDSNNSREDILNNYDKIHMAYVYVVSSLLCGFGLSLCVHEWRSENRDFLYLFSLILPNCIKHAQDIHQKIREKFDIVSRKLHDNTSPNVPKDITKPALNIVNNLKEYVEISFNIITLMQIQITSDSDTALLKAYLEDLESLFHHCNDTLKVLQYQVYKVPILKMESPKKVDDVDFAGDIEKIIIKHDDPQEKLEEEEFNLSIHGSDYSDDEDTPNLEYEQLLEYVRAQKLMIRELNDELKKRNIIKQIDVIPILIRSSNKYKEIQEKPLDVILDDNKAVPPVPPSPSMQKIVPSPPPRITDCNVDSLESRNEFLAQIRAAATSRCVEETVFGSDVSSDESSND